MDYQAGEIHDSSRQSPGRGTDRKGRNLGWLVLACALITAIVCIFSWVATFGLLPRRALASGESMLAADYSPWEGYRVLNLDVVRLATAAAQGDAPWQEDGVAVAEVTLPAPTAVQITSQATPLPTLMPTTIPPTRRPRFPGPTNTLPPTIPVVTSTSTTAPTSPPPPPAPTSPPPAPTSPPPIPTSPPVPTNTSIPPTATDTATPITPTATATETPTMTPTQMTNPPEVNVNQPPDGTYLEFCAPPLVIDLGATPISVPGSSLVYYEYYNIPLNGVLLDMTMVEVCADAACSTPYTLFVWGDGNSSNNGSIPASYYPPEAADVFIPAADLFNNSGIIISMSGVPAGTYRFVRISAPAGSNCASDPAASVQVDAIVVIP